MPSDPRAGEEVTYPGVKVCQRCCPFGSSEKAYRSTDPQKELPASAPWPKAGVVHTDCPLGATQRWVPSGLMA